MNPDSHPNVLLSGGQTILHQVADQAAGRDPFTTYKIKKEKCEKEKEDKTQENTEQEDGDQDGKKGKEKEETIISLADARENELILSGATYCRLKVSSVKCYTRSLIGDIASDNKFVSDY